MNMLMILRIIITMATAVTKTATIIKIRRKKKSCFEVVKGAFYCKVSTSQ